MDIFRILFFGFLFWGLTASLLVAQEVHLNEILPLNGSTLADEDGDFEDWIELYNSGDEPVSLSGFGLSDDGMDLLKWTFPDTTIQSRDFILIWASGKDRSEKGSELHTNFRISADGEEVFLTNSEGVILDQSPERSLAEDISLGRKPDGTGEWVLFNETTPGKSNSGNTSDLPLEEPELSHRPGFYTSAFNLEISHVRDDVTIYYTLDGSVPDEQSPVYDGPIPITDRSNEPNLFSTIPTNKLSTNFREGRFRFREPNSVVPKATLLRVKAVKAGYRPSQITNTFFVFTDGADKHQLPVFSITTDSLNFFGFDTGIYVPGRTYVEGRDDTGNFYQRGKEWERESLLEFFDENGNLQITQKVGIRIHGGFTRRLPQKSLRIYARDEYGKGEISYPFFEDLEYEEYERLVLRNSGNDWGETMFRDAAAHEIVKHFNMDTQASHPSVVYINGEYWGIHNLRERFDDNYLERVYGIDGNNIDFLTGFSQVQYGSSDPYVAMVNFIDSQDLSIEANMDSVKTLMDIDNFIDYFTAQIYFQNTDWPHSNIEFWRLNVPFDKNAPAGLDGRWRWLFYDVDASFGFVKSPDFDMLDYVTQELGINGREWPNTLLRNLLENESFKHDFINRMADHLNTTFQADRVLEIIDRFQWQIDDEISEHSNRWNYPTSKSEWRQSLVKMRGFARRRPDLFWQNILNHFEIQSTESITVDLENRDHGRVRVNSLLISDETPGIKENPYPWTGTYFSGIPIRLTTTPEIGYSFSHWLVDGKQLFEKELTVLPDTTTSVKAVFDNLSLSSFDAHRLADSDYNFSDWPATKPANSYPESMAFVYMNEIEPGLGASIAGITQGVYNLDSRTRINGLGSEGFSFVNTGNEDGNPGYPGTRLGGAVLVLNTVNRDSVTVLWKAGTIEPNSRIYHLRLQYRTGTDRPFQDVLDEEGNPVEYVRNDNAGHNETIGPVLLPDEVDNQSRVELLWRYYYTGERVDDESGARAKLNISEIKVTSGSLLDEPSDSQQKAKLYQNYPNPFYPNTRITYDLYQDQHVRIDLFSIDGRHISTLEDKLVESGRHHIDVNVSDLASGIYLYRLVLEDFSDIKKMSVIK